LKIESRPDLCVAKAAETCSFNLNIFPSRQNCGRPVIGSLGGYVTFSSNKTLFRSDALSPLGCGVFTGLVPKDVVDWFAYFEEARLLDAGGAAFSAWNEKPEADAGAAGAEAGCDGVNCFAGLEAAAVLGCAVGVFCFAKLKMLVEGGASAAGVDFSGVETPNWKEFVGVGEL
jgi:hypothetical protein